MRCIISPFSDNTDFTNAHKGFIAALPTEVIKGEQGQRYLDPQQYAFIKEGEKAPDTVNPSLWRQSQLINISGLFEVTDGVYQIRNLDLSNMTIIEGKEGSPWLTRWFPPKPPKSGWICTIKTAAKNRWR
jgi:alkyl sulfatase BDS1-like metallo-beta-lactamase superfamily hydrolase